MEEQEASKACRRLDSERAHHPTDAWSRRAPDLPALSTAAAAERIVSWISHPAPPVELPGVWVRGHGCRAGRGCTGEGPSSNSDMVDRAHPFEATLAQRKQLRAEQAVCMSDGRHQSRSLAIGGRDCGPALGVFERLETSSSGQQSCPPQLHSRFLDATQQQGVLASFLILSRSSPALDSQVTWRTRLRHGVEDGGLLAEVKQITSPGCEPRPTLLHPPSVLQSDRSLRLIPQASFSLGQARSYVVGGGGRSTRTSEGQSRGRPSTPFVRYPTLSRARWQPLIAFPFTVRRVRTRSLILTGQAVAFRRPHLPSSLRLHVSLVPSASLPWLQD